MNKEQLAKDVQNTFKEATTEVSHRNEYITKRDEFIYGDGVDRALDIPYGHDYTGINWLRRTIEIHAMQFMGRGFQPTSTYDTADLSEAADEEDLKRLKNENDRHKANAETRLDLIKAVIRDNGGFSLFLTLAESGGAVGFSALKTYWDEDEQKMVYSQVETVENLYVLWSDSDFRQTDAVSYVWQISPSKATRDYGLKESELTYTKAGEPFHRLDQSPTPDVAQSTRSMITVMEVTGFIPGWAYEKNSLKKVAKGKENKLNVLIVGDKVVRLESDPKKIPNYYIFPNKMQRRRPYGLSDVTDAAINTNLSYIETISDWRTVANRVNFPKWKAYGFGLDVQLPTPKPRTAELLPLGDGQDIQLLQQGDSNQIDFRAQAEELRDQFAQEVGLSRVFFNDPSLTLNSNQALMTSMKPTTDIAENKKLLWTPILVKMFEDTLETIALWNTELKDVVDPDDNWSIAIKWPNASPKEDPVMQTGLLNRLNANAISLTTYLEELGEGKEELDRIKQDLQDEITASIVSKQVGIYVQNKYFAGDGKPQPKVNVSLRGDLTPQQEGNLADQIGFQDGPFPATIGPQGVQGRLAQENQANEGFLEGEFPNQTPITINEQGQPVPNAPTEDNRQQQATQTNNQPGQQPMSQPGTGAPAVSPEGSIATEAQNRGA